MELDFFVNQLEPYIETNHVQIRGNFNGVVEHSIMSFKDIIAKEDIVAKDFVVQWHQTLPFIREVVGLSLEKSWLEPVSSWQ
uniref:Uncharacterized protein n=1 Tax=Ipomoea trifida TaxID=35884 RepID=A0PAC8_IPOTF|nr:hypothetical protein [Ipomoea trifida]